MKYLFFFKFFYLNFDISGEKNFYSKIIFIIKFLKNHQKLNMEPN